MSEKVNISDAKTRSSPLPNASVKRKPGRLRGRIRIGPDFEEPLPANLFNRAE